MICLYLKIPENFVRLILWDRFQFVQIPFVRMVILPLVSFFFPLVLTGGFHWGLSSCMSPLVSRTPLSVMAYHNNAVIWIVLVRPPISNSSSFLSKPLRIVSSGPITTAITITFRSHNFISSQARF